MNLQKKDLVKPSPSDEILWLTVTEYSKRGIFYVTIYEKKETRKLARHRDPSVSLFTNAARLLLVIGYPPDRRVVMMRPDSGKKTLESTIGNVAKLPKRNTQKPTEKRLDAGESKAIADLAKYRQRQLDRRGRQQQPSETPGKSDWLKPKQKSAKPANDNVTLYAKSDKAA